jgi:hypothetical protein
VPVSPSSYGREKRKREREREREKRGPNSSFYKEPTPTITLIHS